MTTEWLKKLTFLIIWLIAGYYLLGTVRFHTMLNNSLWPFGLLIIAGVFSTLLLINTRVGNKNVKFMENVFLANGLTHKTKDKETPPKLMGITEQEDGDVYIYNIPIGKSTADFLKQKEAIQEPLNKEVDINLIQGKIHIKIKKNSLTYTK